jgi:hypothetical protein
MIKEAPIITGVNVQPSIISWDVVQPVAPIGLDNMIAIALPFEKPINDIKLPPRNKTIIRTNAFLSFVPIFTHHFLVHHIPWILISVSSSNTSIFPSILFQK